MRIYLNTNTDFLAKSKKTIKIDQDNDFEKLIVYWEDGRVVAARGYVFVDNNNNEIGNAVQNFFVICDENYKIDGIRRDLPKKEYTCIKKEEENVVQ